MRSAWRVLLFCTLAGFSLLAHAKSKIDTVHVRSVDELTVAMLSANSSGRPTIIRVDAVAYDLSTAHFDSEFGPSAFPPVTGTIYIDGKDALDTVFNASGNAVRVFTVLPGGKLGVSDATLTGGFTFCGDEGEEDCAPFGGGALLNMEGTAWLEHCVLSGNRAVSLTGYTGATGGAISSIRGNLHLVDTIVIGNTSGGGGGGGLRLVGGSVSVERSIIRANLAAIAISNGGWEWGGGIYATDANLYIANSTIADNQVSQQDSDEWVGYGGGLYSAGGSVKIVDSAVINNAAKNTGAGGGIYNGGQMTLRNVTVAGNSSGTRGGGIYNGGTLKMQSVSIANNSVLGIIGWLPSTLYPDECFQYENQPCPTGGGGLWNQEGATVHMSSTLIANNFNNNSPVVNVPTDCYGVVVSEGFNAVKHSIDCVLQSSNHDLTNMKVRIGDLLDNGEAGNAHFPLLANSPLIDAGGKVGQQCSSRDQIGNRRSDGNNDGATRCDTGAVEFVAPGHGN